MKPKLLIFILGVIVGLLLAILGQPVLNALLPEDWGGGAQETTGQVVAKRLQGDRLLLTLESEDGAVLATFQQRVPEIDLLIEEGDRVTLGITSYEPFVEDPKVLGVKKGPKEAAEPMVPAVSEAPAEPPTRTGEPSTAGGSDEPDEAESSMDPPAEEPTSDESAAEEGGGGGDGPPGPV